MAGPAFGVVSFKQDKRQIIKFGGLPMKVGGTMAYIDLNDQVSWFAQDIVIDNSHIQNSASQRTWLGSGDWLARDFIGRKIDIPVIFDETAGTSLAAFKGFLGQAEEQYLTFDNATGIKCKLNSFAQSQFMTDRDPNYQGGGYLLSTSLQFLSRFPFAEDLAATVVSVGAVAGAVTPGHANNFTASYTGGVYTPPVYTLTIPSGNTATISAITLSNTASGETISAAFSPAITAGVAHTVVFDSTQFTISLDGASVAPSGSFPMFYPSYPAPASNTMTLGITSSAGTTGLTFAYTYTSHWDL